MSAVMIPCPLHHCISDALPSLFSSFSFSFLLSFILALPSFSPYLRCPLSSFSPFPRNPKTDSGGFYRTGQSQGSGPTSPRYILKEPTSVGVFHSEVNVFKGVVLEQNRRKHIFEVSRERLAPQTLGKHNVVCTPPQIAE